MKLFNDQAAAAVASLDSADAAYCAKLEQRFAHMGISSKAASSAVQSLVEADAVPRPALRVQGPLPEENRGEARRLRGVRGFSVRSARLGAKRQAPLLRRMALPYR